MSTQHATMANHSWVIARAAAGTYSPDCLVWTERPNVGLGKLLRGQPGLH